MSSELSNSRDIVKLGGKVYTDQDTDKALESVPPEVKLDFQNHLFSAQFWKQIEETHIPLDLIKERAGAWDNKIKDNVVLEYFPEEYTLQELNRLFPNWWMDEMDVHYEDKLRTVVVKGYLFVEIPTLQGKQVVKRWAIGSVVVQIKKPRKTNEMTEEDYQYILSQGPQPSQPDDRYKAARTEWIKLAGKFFGIGLEIYHQRITSDMRSHFEDIVRPLGMYSDEMKKIAATFEKGHGFRNFLKEIPTINQVKRITEAIGKIPVGTQNDKQEDVRHLIMSAFVKNNNASNENRAKFEKFIVNIEHLALQYDNQKKEE